MTSREDESYEWVAELEPNERDALASMVMQSLRGSWNVPQERTKILAALAGRGLPSFDTGRVMTLIEQFKEQYYEGHHDGRTFRLMYQEAPDVSELVDRQFVERYASKIPNDMTWDDRRIEQEFEGGEG